MYIADFQTKRIKASLRELTIRQAIDLCEIPDSLNEQGITRALNYVVESTNLPIEEWTVQERLSALCSYVTAQEQGEWQLSEGGSISDYLLSADYPEENYRFVDDGDAFEIVPLTGEYAEAVEQMCATSKRVGDWIMAVMAATIRSEHDDFDGMPLERVKENLDRLNDLPQSVFEKFFEHFQAANDYMAHGVGIAYTDDGIAMVKGETGEMPVRFQFDMLISPTTDALWRRTEEDSTNVDVESETRL